MYKCPCCRNLTLPEQPPGTYLICEVCYWEDDLIQYNDIYYCGGANKICLFQARLNYLKIGASSPEFLSMVRKSQANEVSS